MQLQRLGPYASNYFCIKSVCEASQFVQLFSTHIFKALLLLGVQLKHAPSSYLVPKHVFYTEPRHFKKCATFRLLSQHKRTEEQCLPFTNNNKARENGTTLYMHFIFAPSKRNLRDKEGNCLNTCFSSELQTYIFTQYYGKRTDTLDKSDCRSCRRHARDRLFRTRQILQRNLHAVEIKTNLKLKKNGAVKFFKHISIFAALPTQTSGSDSNTNLVSGTKTLTTLVSSVRFDTAYCTTFDPTPTVRTSKPLRFSLKVGIPSEKLRGHP